jgi:hypothetical protein
LAETWKFIFNIMLNFVSMNAASHELSVTHDNMPDCCQPCIMSDTMEGIEVTVTVLCIVCLCKYNSLLRHTTIVFQGLLLFSIRICFNKFHKSLIFFGNKRIRKLSEKYALNRNFCHFLRNYMTKKNSFLNKTFLEFQTAITHFRRRRVCLLLELGIWS